MVYSETHGIPQKEHFFPRNNENRSESTPHNFSERNFDGNPSQKQQNHQQIHQQEAVKTMKYTN